MTKITLDPKYGVNPSITKCNICGTDTGIALYGNLKGKEAPRETFGEICEACEEQIAESAEQGFLVIHILDEWENDQSRPMNQFICGYSVIRKDCDLAQHLRAKTGNEDRCAVPVRLVKEWGIYEK